MTQVDRYQPVNALVEGACLRGEAIHSQLTLGFTFCQVAAQSIALGHIEHAHRIVERLWPSAHTIARHLYVPNHVSPSKIPELRAELERLEGQITEIEERLLNLER